MIIKIKPQQLPGKFAEEFADEINGYIKANLLKIERERHLPLLVCNNFNGRQLQNSKSSIQIDGQRLSDIRHASIVIGPRHFNKKKWGYSSLCMTAQRIDKERTHIAAQCLMKITLMIRPSRQLITLLVKPI
jgi:hypothetical protein